MAHAEHFKDIISSAPMGVIIFDKKGRIELANLAFIELSGYPEHELDKINFFQLCDSEELYKIQEELENLSSRKTKQFEMKFRLRVKNGLLIWIHFLVCPANEKIDNSQIYYGYLNNIEEQKKLEIIDKEKDKIYSIIMNATSDFIAYFESSDYRFKWCNKPDWDANKASQKEFCYEIWHGYSQACSNECPVNKTFNTGKAQKLEKKFNEKIWNIYTYPIYENEKLLGVLEIAHDITELIRNKQELVFSHEQLNRYFDESPLGIIVADMEGHIVRVNYAVQKMTGYSEEELLDMKISEFYQPEMSEFVENLYRDVIEKKKSEVELSYITKNGEKRWWLIDASFLSTKHIIGFIRDITPRKKAEFELAESERRFKTLFMKSQIGIVMGDKQGYFRLFNDTFKSMLGYSHEELRTLRFSDISHPDDVKQDMIAFTDLMRGKIDVYAKEKRILTKDNQYLWVNLIASTTIDDLDDESFIMGMIEDINERKIQEIELEKNNRFNHIRAQIRNIAMKTYDRMEMIYTLLEIIGKEFSYDYASFYEVDENRKYLVNQMEWGSEKKRNTKGLKIPVSALKLVKPKEYYTYSIDNLPSALKPILRGLLEKFGIKTFVAVSYGPIEYPEGFIAWSTTQNKKEIDQEEISMLNELTHLIHLRSDQIKNRNALIQNEEKFRLISENTSDGILVFENETFSFISPSFYRMLGYENDYTLFYEFNNLKDLIHPDDQNVFMETLKSLNEKREKAFIHSFRIKHASGEYIWMEVSFNFNYNDAGKIEKAYAVARNISKRKQLENQLKDSLWDLHQAHKLAQMGTWKYDMYQNYLEWSPETYSIFELEPDEFKNTYQSFLELVHPDDRKMVNFAFNHSVHNKFEYDIVHRLLMKDGRIKFVREIGNTDYDHNGNPFRSLGSIQDITDLKTIELELQQTAAELEQSNRDLERFAYSASHDLKEPLRMISSFANLIDRTLKQKYPDEKDLEDYIAYTKEGANRMATLIDSLLSFSRINKEHQDYQYVDLNIILNDIKDGIYNQFNKDQIKIQINRMPKIYGNAEQIRSVFQNLISNAIKYQQKNSIPHIKIDYSTKNNQYVFRVKDNGIGIKEKYHMKIFDLFSRLHSHSEYPGTGIGLAAVKRIVEFHGGKIWVESEPQKGATFFFTIPKHFNHYSS